MAHASTGLRGGEDENVSSTEKLQVRGSPTALILPAGWELSPYWERSCPPGPGDDIRTALNDADVAAICTACTRAAGRSSRSCSPALPPRWRLAGRSAAMSCGTSPAAVRPPAGAGRHRPARPAGQSAVPRRPPAGHGAAAARGRFPGGPLGGRRPIGYEAVQRYGQTSWQLASPEAAQSDWVGKEIKYWVSSKGTDRLLVVVTDGTWAWDNDSGDLSPTSTAANRALRGVFPAEPKYLDMTWARRDASITLRNVKFRGPSRHACGGRPGGPQGRNLGRGCPAGAADAPDCPGSDSNADGAGAAHLATRGRSQRPAP